MKDNLIIFDKEKLSDALKEDGRTKSRVAKDAMVNRKTLDKALAGQSVRPVMATRIAKTFKKGLNSFLSDGDQMESDYQNATIDLTEADLTEGYLIDNSTFFEDQEINTFRVSLFPSGPDEIVSALARGFIQTGNIFGSNPKKLHPPYWHIEPDVTRSPDLVGSLKLLDAALKEQKEKPNGARALESLISSLETEFTVASALEQLATMNVHVLAGQVKVRMNNGNPDPSEVIMIYSNVPILVIARTTVDTAQITYRSLEDIFPF